MRADLPPVAPVSKDCGPNEHWDTASQSCFHTVTMGTRIVTIKIPGATKARMDERENATY